MPQIKVTIGGGILLFIFYSTVVGYFVEGETFPIRLPFLVFDFYVSLNKFSPSQYFSKDISHRKELHDIIWKFHLQGWGYTKIHQYLIKNNFEIGKSRTSVYHILKKLKKRKQVLSQNEVGEYQNFELVWIEDFII
uniref:Uncharacterized protein n=1 Tax=uncultured Fidelibacterota bacterium HF0010_18O13 TaxID=710789 RepID=E0XR85_9BACT|nr:hypothetical protein [uncultured Marinimicrobia bacterium HF0010_18O13]